MSSFFVEDEIISIGKFNILDLEKFSLFTPHNNILLNDYNLCFLDKNDKRQWAGSIKNKKNKYFSVLLKEENNRLIGYIAIKKTSLIDTSFELSIGLDAKYSSKGYGFMALKLFLDYYFENIQSTIWLNVNSFNERAIALYEKIGFEKISEFYGGFEVQNMQKMESFKNNREHFMVKRDIIYSRIFSMKLDRYRFMEMWG